MVAAQVQSLVWELRSHIKSLHNMAEREKRKKEGGTQREGGTEKERERRETKGEKEKRRKEGACRPLKHYVQYTIFVRLILEIFR